MQHADGTFVLQKGDENAHEFIACERMLGETLKPLMAEIYLVNCGIMASYIFAQSDANLRDVLESSMEALRRPELVRYGRRAAVEIDWESRVAITLGMEFVHESLTAEFELVFNCDCVGVDITGIAYRGEPVDDGYALLARAISDLSRTDA